MIANFDAVREMKAYNPKLFEEDTSMRFLAIMHRLKKEVDIATMTPRALAELREIADHIIMEEIRNHVDTVVKDPKTAEKLKPWYGYTCKRPTFNDEYLEALNRPNVTLVDVSATQGVERITENGVVANGVEYPLDLIVYASGFEITSDFHKRIGIPIYGRDNVSIYDYWRGGMRTLLGLMTHGFPNMFFVGGLFTFSLSINYCSTLDPQAQVIAGLIRRLLDDGHSIHPTIEAEDDWIRRQIEAGAQDFAVPLGTKGDDCTPGYYNHEGRSFDQRRDFRREGYGKGSIAYLSVLSDWAKASEVKGVEVLRSR
jgi:cyclohexanone monooxygenase